MIEKKHKIIIPICLLFLFGLSFLVYLKPVSLLSVSGRPSIDQDGYLAENILYDSSTSQYWWVFSDRNVMGIRMASSSNLVDWEVSSDLLIDEKNLDSACIRRFGGIWYLYYAKHLENNGRRANIWMRSSKTINSGYSSPKLVLDINDLDDWDSFRVSEPDIVWRDGKYFLFYMGESKDKYEKVGYAIANSPSGPFVKYVNNPVLYGSEIYRWRWDSGHDRAADPYIFEIEEGYIIQYTACRVAKREWSIGWAFTKDFVSFKVPDSPILTSGSWANEAVSRGCILKVRDKYYMSFAGYDGWTMKYSKCGLMEIPNFEEVKNKLIE